MTDDLEARVTELEAQDARWRVLAFGSAGAGGIDAAESEAYAAMERRYAAELDSLRGVVQAVREWLAKAEPYPELNGNLFAEVRAALAAAPDA